MDFQNVPPVAIKVRDVSLSIEQPTPLLEKLHRRKHVDTPTKRILQGISLDVPSGSFMAIVGASGSGKVIQTFRTIIENRLRY